MNRPGIAVLSAGTADVLSTAFSEPKLNDAMFDGFYPCYLHAKRDMCFTFALNHIGGILLRWYRDTLGGEEVRAAEAAGRDPYDVMVESVPGRTFARHGPASFQRERQPRVRHGLPRRDRRPHAFHLPAARS